MLAALAGAFKDGNLSGLPPFPDTSAAPVRETEGRVAGRALIGWLDEEEAARWLGGNEFQPARDPLHRELARRAKSHVDARAPFNPGPTACLPLPASVEHHLGLLRTHPESAGPVAQMGDPMLVDLSNVIAAQKQILVADAENRVRAAVGADELGLARITLPLPRREPISWTFDAQRNAFIVTSPNPNLRVAGHFNSTVGGETPGVVFDGFGFALSYQRSYLQVAVIGDRAVLRDGYHRCYGLLKAGVRQVPAFVKRYASWAEAGMPAGLLPEAVCLGERPPLLTDYLDDAVAMDRWIPATRKLLLIQALELNVPA